jgi:2-haloalkanoic acid dehalogenase type II
MARYDAVLFDLLTALLDSWSLWDSVAGNQADGRRWRAAYLRAAYETGAYRPYEVLVAEAAEAAGLDRSLANKLERRWGELRPWPDVRNTLTAFAHAGIPLGVVTNCSRRLGFAAAKRVGVPFVTVVTAEDAGFYKPDPRPYRQALAELGVAPERCLFVAGSAYGLAGTAQVGLPTYWHDRVGTPKPEGVRPLAQTRTLLELPRFCGLF